MRKVAGRGEFVSTEAETIAESHTTKAGARPQGLMRKHIYICTEGHIKRERRALGEEKEVVARPGRELSFIRVKQETQEAMGRLGGGGCRRM